MRKTMKDLDVDCRTLCASYPIDLKSAMLVCFVLSIAINSA